MPLHSSARLVQFSAALFLSGKSKITITVLLSIHVARTPFLSLYLRKWGDSFDINRGLAPASRLAIFFPRDPETFEKMHCKLQIIDKKLIKSGINTIYYGVFSMMSEKQYKQIVN